ncbi:uncharacterized protein [Amphiura filiformis]|uniref:uncharacterized protein isoform X3 n=1 Tax=Amphiura filiformis TaxID=82378 RepID=UPI003B2259FE
MMWQKKLKAEEDKVVEGGGDGLFERAQEDDHDSEETEQTEDDDDSETDHADEDTDEEEDDDDEEEEEEEEDDSDSDSDSDDGLYHTFHHGGEIREKGEISSFDTSDVASSDEDGVFEKDYLRMKKEVTQPVVKNWKGSSLVLKEKKKEESIKKREEVKLPVVKKRKVPSLWLINKRMFLENVKLGNRFIACFGNLGCEKCQKFYEDYRLVLHYFHDTKQKVDAYLITEKQLLDEFNFQKDEYPAILYYRHGIPVLYEGALTATGVQSWVENHSKIAVKELTDDNFHRTVVVTDEKSSQWLVLFYDPQDPKCWRPLALTETLALKQDKLNIGIVDISKNKVLAGKLKDKSNIPSWFLFRKDDMIQLEFLERLTLRHIEETYKEASMTLQEKLGRAAVQVKSIYVSLPQGFLMYTGGAVTVVLFIFICLCKKVAYVGERRVKKGV